MPRSAELELPGATASIPQARRFAKDTLLAWGFDQLLDAAALVVSELATNAVLHARSPFTVRLQVEQDGRLRVEVVDGSVRRPEQRRHSQGATTGRGMGIVAELAEDWGVEPQADGKVVWARLGEHADDALAARDRRGPGGGAPGQPDQARPDGPQVRAA